MTDDPNARLAALCKQHPTRHIWHSSDGRWYATSTIAFTAAEILAGHTMTVTALNLGELADELTAQPVLARTAA